MSSPKVCIVGAGLSGLLLGRCLLKRGIQATLFEKAPESARRNQYGITLHRSSYVPLLELLGIEEAVFRRKVITSGDEDYLHREDSLRVNRAKFESFLKDTLDIKYDHQLESVDSESPSPILHFSNGDKYQSKALVGADGVHSQVRQAVAPQTQFKVLPFAVYNGKRRIPRDAFENIKPPFAGKTKVEQRVGSSLFQISIDDEGREQISISYNFSRPAKENQADPLYRPTRSKTDAKEIPEAFFHELDKYQLEEPFRTVFDSSAVHNDRLLNWLMRTIQVDRQSLNVAAEKHIVLLGEAAHAEPILGGYGANEAIEDAMQLAIILGEDSSLSNFYDIRHTRWQQDIDASVQRIEEMHSESRLRL